MNGTSLNRILCEKSVESEGRRFAGIRVERTSVLGAGSRPGQGGPELSR